MRAVHSIVSLPVLFVAVLVAGCGNPADNAAEAFVGEPLPVPGAEVPIAESADAVPGAATSTPVDGRRYTFGAGPDIETQSRLEWLASKVTRSHAGGFRSFAGEILMPTERPEDAQLRADVVIYSLYTDGATLTSHLWSDDFFDAAKFPTATFVSTGIAPSATGYDITGNLEMHGVTKSITFPATIAVSEDTVTADAEFFIRRSDWGISYAGAADDLIREEVVLRMHIVATPAEDGVASG